MGNSPRCPRRAGWSWPTREMRMLMLMSSRGEGKSTASIYACLEIADRMIREGYQWALPLRVAVIRDTWINLQRTTLVSFEQARAKGLPLEFAEGGRQITLIDQGRAVVRWVLFGIDQPKDVDNLQGFEGGVLWPEEVAPAAGFTSGVPKEVLGVGVSSLRQ